MPGAVTACLCRAGFGVGKQLAGTESRRKWECVDNNAMRNGQNKRMRGRNNRKGQNPLTRVYESNGPDVKIRGTASHVADKYVQLARDAQASGRSGRRRKTISSMPSTISV